MASDPASEVIRGRNLKKGYFYYFQGRTSLVIKAKAMESIVAMESFKAMEVVEAVEAMECIGHGDH